MIKKTNRDIKDIDGQKFREIYSRNLFCIKVISFVAIFFLLISNSIAQPEFPKLTAYATDLTGTLSSSEISQLNKALAMFEDSTSTQIVFLMIPSLEDYSLEMYAYETAAKNKIGTKGNNNGVLFLVSKNDRKMRIEVGYGLEGALPDALASSIIRNEVAPYFKRDDYSSGVVAGLRAIILATQGEYRQERRTRVNDDEKNSIGSIIPLIIFIIIFIISRKGGRGGRGGGLFYIGGFGGGGGFSSGGGGGGFGGFSGGGGGFGGGGASGGW